MKQESDKLQYISVLRVSSMLLIVLFHSMCFYIGAWWYLCTEVVPLWKTIAYPLEMIGLTTFVFISGFLYGYMYYEKGKYRDVFSFLNKKFRRLLIPYVFWGILMIITMPTVQISWINLFTGVAHLWFLLMLFELFVIMVILNKLGIVGGENHKIVDLLIVILSFGLVYVWKTCSVHRFALGIEGTLYYFPTFLIGYFYAKYRRFAGTPFRISFMSIVIGVFLTFFLSIYDFPDFSTLYRIPCVIVAVSGFLLLNTSSVSFNQSAVLSNLDENCMGIYILNQIVVFILLLNPIINKYLSQHIYIGFIFLFIISLLIPWLLSNLIKKIKYLSFIIG